MLDAWGGVSIEGWRKSLDDVATFYFTRLPDSYAARTGRPDNVGVIGVALFPERRVCCRELLDETRRRRRRPGRGAGRQAHDRNSTRRERIHASARVTDIERLRLRSTSISTAPQRSRTRR